KPLALIIEDDFDLSEIFSDALQGDGFETEIVRDGKTAIERLAGIAPSIIVLDLHLPYVGGATILQSIHATEHFSKTGVIVATADAQQADGLRGKADLVLLKPVSVGQLRELAKRLLLRWQANDTANP
ncbi:MAG: response regulator transcription factor, partial [Anaerolineales bacterium]|nr:response regulator transcription factor [Anaerolineales bacterium]